MAALTRYRYPHFRRCFILEDMTFRGGPEPAEDFPGFDLVTIDGGRIRKQGFVGPATRSHGRSRLTLLGVISTAKWASMPTRLTSWMLVARLRIASSGATAREPDDIARWRFALR